MRQSILLSIAVVCLALVYSQYGHAPTTQRLTSTEQYRVANCTEQLEVQCAFEIERTVIACSKAFETEGADVIADIKCAKDLLSDKKFCWPCICAEAKKKDWKIVGC